MPRRTSIVLHWAAALVAVSVAVVAQQQARIQTGPPPKLKMPPKDRTTARLDALTPAQRYHSTLFPEAHSEGNRMLDAMMHRTMIDEPPVGAQQRSLRDFLYDATCGDLDRAVFLGTVASGSAFPIDDGSFLFTDYTVVVTKTLKHPFGRILKDGESVVVGRLGGELEVEGVPVRTISNRFPLLKSGTRYMFFARHHRGYKVFHTKEATLLVNGGRLTALAPEFLMLRDADSTALPHGEVESLMTKLAPCR